MSVPYEGTLRSGYFFNEMVYNEKKSLFFRKFVQNNSAPLLSESKHGRVNKYSLANYSFLQLLRGYGCRVRRLNFFQKRLKFNYMHNNSLISNWYGDIAVFYFLRNPPRSMYRASTSAFLAEVVNSSQKATDMSYFNRDYDAYTEEYFHNYYFEGARIKKNLSYS